MCSTVMVVLLVRHKGILSLAIRWQCVTRVWPICRRQKKPRPFCTSCIVWAMVIFFALFLLACYYYNLSRGFDIRPYILEFNWISKVMICHVRTIIILGHTSKIEVRVASLALKSAFSLTIVTGSSLLFYLRVKTKIFFSILWTERHKQKQRPEHSVHVGVVI